MMARKLLVIVSTAVSLYGWIDHAFGAPTKIKWTEEVQLHDGTVIQIKRVEELGTSGFPVQRRGFTKFFEFCYPPMGIYWKSRPEYWPETFDIVDGKAYAKVTISSCFECRDHGYPETNALYFIWERGAWKKIDYAAYPKGLRLNLLMDSHLDDDGTRDVHGPVSLAEKAKRDFGLYSQMKAAGVSGRNEPPYLRNTCQRCKAIQLYDDSPSSEVFLPSNRKDCE